MRPGENIPDFFVPAGLRAVRSVFRRKAGAKQGARHEAGAGAGQGASAEGKRERDKRYESSSWIFFA